jgi:intraflagellar transport protein 122
MRARSRWHGTWLSSQVSSASHARTLSSLSLSHLLQPCPLLPLSVRAPMPTSSSLSPFSGPADGSQLVVAVGRRLVIYNPADGSILRQKAAHQKDIFCVSCSRDGAYIASGGADKTVSLWNWELNQKYTFTHAESVQAVAFNPVTANILATASVLDFAIWTMPSATLKKFKLPSRACCCAWTSDGQLLALGLHCGTVTVRDLNCVEKYSFKRTAPVWDLHWAPARGVVLAVGEAPRQHPVDLLSVACWDGTLSFYAADGRQVGKDRPSPGGCDPTSIRSFGGGDYILVAGSDKKAFLMTRDGIKLNSVADGKAWIWRAAPRPRSNSVAIACNDGTVALFNITFSTVHGLYGDRYASRELGTDVVVQHLVSEARVRIKCR